MIGDTVNLASRLVGVAKQHGVEIVMSGMTAARIGGQLATRSLGAVTVRGKSVEVGICTLA